MKKLIESVLAFDRQRASQLVAVVIFLGAVLNIVLIIFTALDLSPDEAHYWEWAHRLDWAYYSKGPTVALLIRASTLVFGDTPLGVRFPAVVCQGLFTWFFFLCACRLGPPGLAALLTLAIRTTPLFAYQGVIITTDPPLSLFWILAVWAVISGGARLGVMAGAMLGLAFLTKYTAAIVPAALLCLAFISHSFSGDLRFVELLRDRVSRKHLLTFVAAFGVALIPVIVWNMTHGWVNLAHNAGHLSSHGGKGFPGAHFLEVLGAQLGLLGPSLFVLIVLAVGRAIRVPLRARPEVQALLAFSLPLLALIVAISLRRTVYANWPMPGFISALLLVPLCIQVDREFTAPVTKYLRYAFYWNIPVTLLSYLLFLGFTFGVNPDLLPTKKLAGWRDLGSDLQKVVKQSPDATRAVAVISDNYDILSELAFYGPRNLQRLCALPSGGRRMNQYDIWGGWEAFRGGDGVVILKENSTTPSLFERFQSISEIRNLEIGEIQWSRKPIRRFSFFVGHLYNGEPNEIPDQR